MPTTLLHGESWEQAYSRRFSEEAYLDRRLDWVLNRTEEILKDDDYCMELLNAVHTDHPHLILAVARATFGDCINILGDLHRVLTRYARQMAESEASVRSFH